MALPTSAAASTRGRRATKKIWASMFSAYGMDRSNTAPSLTGVLPTNGASTQAANASMPNPPTVHTIRRRTGMRERSAGDRSVRSANRHNREMTGPRMKLDIGLDVVELPDMLHRQRLGRGPLREHPSLLQEDDPFTECR